MRIGLIIAAVLAANAIALVPKVAFATSNLNGGQWLYPGNNLYATNGAVELSMQTDGNLVLYTVGCDRRAIWASNTSGQSPRGLIMQTDGNLVLYNTAGSAYWATGTQGHSGAYLTLQTDGNMVVYGPGALWATNQFTSPIVSCSFYVTAVNTSLLYNLGCSQGQLDAVLTTNSFVVLDFGAQTSDNSGTYLPIYNRYATYAQDESMAESFAQGYYTCTGIDHSSVLQLSVGTNNSGGLVNGTGGNAWTSVVSTVAGVVSSSGWGSQVQVWGGSDIELEYASQSVSISWVNGYSGRYVDFGDAQSCPSCYGGWTDYGVWYVSWGAPPAYPFPEIYYSHQLNEWTNIGLDPV